jgi:hypothetical protein
MHRFSIGLLMTANAILFLLGSILHAGYPIGSFHEPRILPASIVEGLCAFLLASGATTVFMGTAHWRLAALVANFVSMAGVLLGMAALAVRAGPRTRSNDLGHVAMLLLIAICLVLFLIPSGHAMNRPSTLRR